MFELIAEDFIRDEVIESEVGEISQEVANEVLSHYDTKVMRREMKEVCCEPRDLDPLLLDLLYDLYIYLTCFF